MKKSHHDLYSIEYNKLAKEKLKTVNCPKINKVVDVISEEMPQLLTPLPYYDSAYIKKLSTIAADWRNRFDTVIVVAMGGALLNSVAIRDFVDKRTNVEIIFVDRVCKVFLQKITNSINQSRTGFIFISNSGNTIEVVSIAQYFNHFLTANSITDFQDRAIFIYGNNPNSLLAETHYRLGGMYLPYDSKMGGRFSTFTTPHILTGMLLGSDCSDFFDGANSIIKPVIAQESEVCQSIIIGAELYNKRQLSIINCSYDLRLDGLVDWYSTALAETLGKRGININITNLKLPLDQHGLLQAILVNSADQIVNLFSLEHDDSNDLDKIVIMMKKGIKNQFMKHNIPLRQIKLFDNSNKALGKLMMHLVLEMVSAAVILGVYPFTQPEIDGMKKNLADTYRGLF